MSSHDEELRKLVDEEIAKQDERITRSVERGGLPTEDEIEAVWTALNAAHDSAEALVWRVEGIAESDDGSELPSTITLEEIGIATVLAGYLEDRASDFAKFAASIRKIAEHELNVIRENQLRAADKTTV